MDVIPDEAKARDSIRFNVDPDSNLTHFNE
jgi:hypothetical protein